MRLWPQRLINSLHVHRHHSTARSTLTNRNSRTVSWCCVQCRLGALDLHALRHTTPPLSAPWWAPPPMALDPNCGAEIF
jgi:hypothetical protein